MVGAGVAFCEQRGATPGAPRREQLRAIVQRHGRRSQQTRGGSKVRCLLAHQSRSQKSVCLDLGARDPVPQNGGERLKFGKGGRKKTKTTKEEKITVMICKAGGLRTAPTGLAPI